MDQGKNNFQLTQDIDLIRFQKTIYPVLSERGGFCQGPIFQ